MDDKDREFIVQAIKDELRPLLDLIEVQALLLGEVAGLLISNGLLSQAELDDRIEKRARNASEQQQALLAIAQRALNPNSH